MKKRFSLRHALVLCKRNLIKITRTPEQLIDVTLQPVIFLLLFLFVFVFGGKPNRHWVWLPFIWGLEIVFVCGISLITASLNVFIRDIRYVVESVNTVLFCLVPIVYSFSIIPPAYKEIYLFNPVAAMVMALRTILLDGAAPAPSLLIKLAISSLTALGIGFLVFRRLKTAFYDYL